MAFEEDVVRLFNQDIREKRSAGSGVFKRKGKGVKHGIRGVRFPYDSLTASQKRKLNGEVIVVRGLGVKLNIEEFKKNDESKQKEILEHWRKLYASKEIQEFLGIDKNLYYNLLYNLNILERPTSANSKAKTNVVSTNKRNTDVLPDATTDDIISFAEFKILSPEKQLEMLDVLYGKYNTHSIAEVWGKTLNNIYNIKHQAKKKLEKKSATTTNDFSVTDSEKVERKPKDNSEIVIHQMEMGIDEVNITENNKIPVTVNNEQEVIKELEVSQPTNDELNALKEMIFEQNKVIQSILSMQQEVAASVVERQETVQSTIPVTVNAKKSNSMEFAFESESEGFILHQDIKRFISVLEKNPDMFAVEIKIKRKE